VQQLCATLDTSIGDVNRRLDSMGDLLAELRNFIMPQAPPPPLRDANANRNGIGDGEGLGVGGVKGTGATAGLAAPDLEGGRGLRVSSFHEDEALARAS
jgi:hypothetical protein|tara:strand:- start:242 stop:538 length:297 start_codon:yes stop_codon:yes gene_type:complete